MNNEIIEFLLFKLEQNYKCEKEDYFILYKPDIKDLLDYITNLQGQLHQASLDIQELTERDLYCPTNCDKLTNLQQELKEANESIKWWDNRFKAVEKENERLKESIGELTNRNVKASVYILENIKGNYFKRYDDEIYKMCDDLLEILKGDSDE